MPRRMPKRGDGGRFLPHAQREPKISRPAGVKVVPITDRIKDWQNTPVPAAPVKASSTEHPDCFGCLAEMSSACDNCPSYNACARETQRRMRR